MKEVAAKVDFAVWTTVQAWFRECESLGGHFSQDNRGKLQGSWILDEEDLLSRFWGFLKRQKRVTVDVAHMFVNKELLDPATCGVSALDLKKKYGLYLPVSRTTVHTWTKRADCKFDKAKQSYYTDGHNKPEVIAYRKECIEEIQRVALRLPLWVQTSAHSLTSVELESLRSSSDGWEFHEFVSESGEPFVEFHVDRLGKNEAIRTKNDNGRTVQHDTYTSLRAATGTEGGNMSARFHDDFRARGCPCNHTPDVCKCDKAAHHIGQDEACFKVFLREGNEWIIRDVRRIRKKSEGPSLMVSAFQDEIRGFGLPMTADELARANTFRVSTGRPLLTESAGTRYVEVGKNKVGFWTGDDFCDQAEDIMDCFDAIYPEKQLVMEVDHYSGHGKHRDGGLYSSAMNVKWGGARGHTMRSTTVTDACLGDGEARMIWGGVKYNCKLKAGDTQHMCFQPRDPPPFHDQKASPSNRRTGKKVKDKSSGLLVEAVKLGYVGQPKGKRQVIWERELWRKGMRCGDNVPPELDLDVVLGQCPDFKNKKSQLEHLVESRGHRLIMSPKCHPELAGLGVEYSWGKSKLEFRRRINHCIAKNVRANVLKALDRSNILTLARMRRFARKTRDYRRVYAILAQESEEAAQSSLLGGKGTCID